MQGLPFVTTEQKAVLGVTVKYIFFILFQNRSNSFRLLFIDCYGYTTKT